MRELAEPGGRDPHPVAEIWKGKKNVDATQSQTGLIIYRTEGMGCGWSCRTRGCGGKLQT